MSAPYSELEKVFHQPRRLELMAELCSAQSERSFSELKEACDLTDGNLSRHLQALEEVGAIKIKKSFVDSKPLTTVSVTAKGRDEFLKYLNALEQVLSEASERVSAKASRSTRIRGVKPARA